MTLSENQDMPVKSASGPPATWECLVLSLAAGAAVGWLDLILSLGAGGQRLATISAATGCLAATSWAATAFLMTATLASAIAARLSRPRAAIVIIERASVTAALAPALLALRDTVRGALITGWSLNAILMLVACLATPVLASRLVGGWRCGSAAGRMALLVRIMVILAALTVALWCFRFERGIAEIAGPAAAIALAIVAWFGASALAHGTSRLWGARRALVAACLLTLLSPVASLLPRPFSPAAVVAADAASRPRPPVVILLTVDTLRWDAVGFNQAAVDDLAATADGAVVASGSAPEPLPHTRVSSTPQLDQLAGQGVVFTQARSSAPWTLPSFVSIHTGRSPDVHGATRPESRAPSGLDTLASRLRVAGYVTAAFGANPFLRPQANLCRGFDTYDFYPRPSASLIGGRLLERFHPAAFRTDVSTSDLTDLALEWLNNNARRPLFLWLHYFDPHAPYAPPPDFAPARPQGVTLDAALEYADDFRAGRFIPTLAERQYLHKLYDAEVRYVDREIGRLLDGLRRMNLFDRSLIVFTSDHGEELWDHDGFEHGHSVYDELIHVPLIVKPPADTGAPRSVEGFSDGLAAARADRRCARPVSLEQIVPTVQRYCGASADDRPPWRPPLPGLFDDDSNRTSHTRGPGAVSAAPANESAALGDANTDADDDDSQQTDAGVSSGLLYYENRHAVMFDHYKYVVTDVGGREALFDLQADPDERCSLVAARPDLASVGRGLLRRHLDSARSLRERLHLSNERVAIDVDTQRRLRSLGYID